MNYNSAKRALLLCVFVVLGLSLSACVGQSRSGNTSLGLGCTEDFVTYKKDLESLLEESEEKEAAERLQEIIDFTNCEEEPAKE